MAKQAINLKEELWVYKIQHNLIQSIDCSKEENKEFLMLIESNQPLPSDVYRVKSSDGSYFDSFYRVVDADIDREDMKEYLMIEQNELLRTIKNGVSFFVVLTILGILISLVAWVSFRY